MNETMKKLIFFIVVFLAIASCKEQKNNLVWSDEFNYNGLPDNSKWSYEVGHIRNNEQQYYAEKRIENSVVKDGYLMLIGKKESYSGSEYTSASINTETKFGFKYGKVEARMKLPAGQGMWPAFWMMGINRSKVDWPKCGEIDIMEHINSVPTVFGTGHWDSNGHVSSGGMTRCNVSQFHNYAVEWDQDSIRWLLDGTRYYGISIKDGVNSTASFHEPFYILLNLAIGGDWPGNTDSTTVFPDTVYVDYVRVYRNNPR
jgi:beta-glucanase (GH16 family)